MFRSFLYCLLVGLPCLTSPLEAGAAGLRSETEYEITLSGLPIARASFLTEIDSSDYTISGRFVSAGIASLVADISARTSVSGRISGSRLQSAHYRLVYKKGRKIETYDVTMRDGDVIGSQITPKPKPRPKTWIPVTEADLKSVLDPLTGLIIADDEAVCPRTLPIFDGESRMDLVLVSKGKRLFAKGDVQVEAVVCGLRYVPRSGFRRGRNDIEYLARSTGMEIWFAKTGKLSLYAPVHARIPTRYGPVHVTAVKFDG